MKDMDDVVYAVDGIKGVGSYTKDLHDVVTAVEDLKGHGYKDLTAIADGIDRVESLLEQILDVLRGGDGLAVTRPATPSHPMVTTAATGSVKWYHPTKGFGFLIRDGDYAEVFFTVDSLEDTSALHERQRVAFEWVDAERGPLAVRVRAQA